MHNTIIYNTVPDCCLLIMKTTITITSAEATTAVTVTPAAMTSLCSRRPPTVIYHII